MSGPRRELDAAEPASSISARLDLEARLARSALECGSLLPLFRLELARGSVQRDEKTITCTPPKIRGESSTSSPGGIPSVRPQHSGRGFRNAQRSPSALARL